MFDVIAIGSGTRDVFLISPLFKLLRDPRHLKKIGFSTGEAQCFALGSKIEIGPPVLTTGGGAANAATTFSRQNFKTAALFKIGRDESAEAILKQFKKEKITPLLAFGENTATAYSAILLAPTGERTILVYRGASEDLKISEIPFKHLKSEWVYISPGKISFRIIEKLFDYFSRKKSLIAFNPSKYFLEMGIKKLKLLFAKSKVVILNQEEAAYLIGIDYKKEKEIFRKMDKLIPGILVMTKGGKGVVVSDGSHLYSAGNFKEKRVVDRTGAGDAFGSGFVAGLIQRKEKCEKGKCRIDDIKYAIRLGSANATSVIEKIGANKGILTKREFETQTRWLKLPIKIIKI